MNAPAAGGVSTGTRAETAAVAHAGTGAGTGAGRSRRWLIARRSVQVGILVLFWLGVHRHVPILVGNLSAATVLGRIPLADPFALLQIALTGHRPEITALVGAGIVVALYAVLGRVFCGWVCPVNIVSDLAGFLRTRAGDTGRLRLPRQTRYWVLALSLVLSAALGVPAFEILSPVAMVHRELIFGAGGGLLAVAAIFAFERYGTAGGWCGHLCPLGAFHTLIGRAPRVRPIFVRERCDRCLDCMKVCPEPNVIHFPTLEQHERVVGAECTNCFRCADVCPTDAFVPAMRLSWSPLERASQGGNT